MAVSKWRRSVVPCDQSSFLPMSAIKLKRRSWWMVIAGIVAFSIASYLWTASRAGDLRREFFEAIESGAEGEVRVLLGRGADPNSRMDPQTGSIGLVELVHQIVSRRGLNRGKELA